MARTLETLEDLYVDELQELHHAEQQLAQALPEMARCTSSGELRQSFLKDVECTRSHVNRLATILKQMDRDTAGRRCQGMEGLLEEGIDEAGHEQMSAARNSAR